MKSNSPSLTPLRKKTLKGDLYTRDGKIEAKLLELLSLPFDEVVSLCLIRREDPAYVPSECLLYLLRIRRAESFDNQSEQLYKILAERVLRSLPLGESSDGKMQPLSKLLIRDEVFGRFIELLASDRISYSEKLDYYEVRFDDALASLRRDAQEKVWREANRSTNFQDEETGEVTREVELAAGCFDPFDASKLAETDYRSRLDVSIDSLPMIQRRIIEMLLKNIPIDSKEPDAVTISKTLGKSEKTIRTHRDKAIARLRLALTGGKML